MELMEQWASHWTLEAPKRLGISKVLCLPQNTLVHPNFVSILHLPIYILRHYILQLTCFLPVLRTPQATNGTIVLVTWTDIHLDG